MGQPFSVRVGGEDWRRDAEAWVRDRTAEQGLEVIGPIEQPRIRPWSTQLTVPTDQGRLWFKANCPALAFEPLLQAELAAIVPDSIDAPFAVDADRGWMLTRDRGETLGDSHEATIDDWRDVLGEAAHLQKVVSGESARLLVTGLPDCSPGTVVERYDRLVSLFAELPDTHPAHVPPGLEARFRAARPALVDAVEVLVSSVLPTTWQHGDLHPRNVFSVGGRLRLFDFGDAQWSHAVEVLSVPYGWMTERAGLRWEDARDAYCDVWGITAGELEPLWQASALTQPVNRTLLWWRALDQATAAEWGQWGEGPLHHLTRVLEP